MNRQPWQKGLWDRAWWHGLWLAVLLVDALWLLSDGLNTEALIATGIAALYASQLQSVLTAEAHYDIGGCYRIPLLCRCRGRKRRACRAAFTHRLWAPPTQSLDRFGGGAT